MAYQVITPLVIAKQEDGSDLYLYQGAPVPEKLREGEIDRLVAGEFISEVEEAAAPFPIGDPADSWKVDELKAYADSKSIDLGDAKKKDEILAAIAAATAPAS